MEQRVSYDAQINYYETYILSRPEYTLSGIFADEGVSGTDCSKQEAFLRLMEAARDGQIDLIITKSVSRFGRNTLDCLKNIRELKALGVDIFFEKENIHTLESNGELLLSLVAAIAQNESFNQSENVKWGIRRKYERGQIKSIPSGKFLGYKKDARGNLIIDDVQAAVVRRIYQEFLNGFGTYQIAMRLTKEEVPMAYGGKEWCASHIRKVLINEKYQGDTRFQKTYNADYLTKRRAKNNGELPQYYLKDSHPPIIDRESWSLVQLELNRQQQFMQGHFMTKYHHFNPKYPLSSRSFCQSCGHALVMRASARKADAGQKYWICKGYGAGRFGPTGLETCCNGNRISDAAVEDLLLTAWNAMVDHFWQVPDSNHDKLLSYRERELRKLIAEYSSLSKLPYSLLLQVLDHIEVNRSGDMSVFFLAGIEYSMSKGIQLVSD
jgi:DNA invertase Pin-like site-specific DNA recombinase